MRSLPTVILLITTTLLSCNSSKVGDPDCFFARYDSIAGTDFMVRLKNDFADSLEGWVDTGIPTVQSFKGRDWTIDYVLLNSRSDKCLIYVVGIDTTCLEFDYYALDMFAGEHDGDVWQFYPAGSTFYLPRESFDASRIHEAHYLTRRTVSRILEWDCTNVGRGTVDDRFFDRWLDGGTGRHKNRPGAGVSRQDVQCSNNM
jgi:hypothetical protein